MIRLWGIVVAFAVCSAAPTVTFNKEVLPILQKRCQDCHRPGEAAPMPLLNYQDARPWAKAIRQAVVTKRMPPWFADPHYGKFANDRSLRQDEIDTLVAWVDGGVKEGNPQDAPAPRQFVEGWNIGKPDLVLQMPNAFEIPATGTIEYQYVVIPTNLTEDKWIQATEVRPENRSVMHHETTFIREPGSPWMADAQPGVPYVPKEGSGSVAAGGRLGSYVPGQVIPPADGPRRATLLKAGSDIVFQLHYTTNGKATTDRTKIGIVFAKEPPPQKLVGANAAAMRFAIPPGDSNYKITAASIISYDCDLVSMMPHAHLRGRRFEYRIIRPDGQSETVLKVPRYDFNWQLTYYLEKPIHMSKGTKLEVTGWYDNSPNNPYNPDPSKEVHWGEQIWEEMMMGYFNVIVANGAKEGATSSGNN